MKSNLLLFIVLIHYSISTISNLKFQVDFTNDHPFNKEVMWHPHLTKTITADKNFIIEDRLTKIYPAQLVQIRSPLMKKRINNPKVNCGCKFISHVEKNSFIQVNNQNKDEHKAITINDEKIKKPVTNSKNILPNKITKIGNKMKTKFVVKKQLQSSLPYIQNNNQLFITPNQNLDLLGYLTNQQAILQNINYQGYQTFVPVPVMQTSLFGY